MSDPELSTPQIILSTGFPDGKIRRPSDIGNDSLENRALLLQGGHTVQMQRQRKHADSHRSKLALHFLQREEDKVIAHGNIVEILHTDSAITTDLDFAHVILEPTE